MIIEALIVAEKYSSDMIRSIARTLIDQNLWENHLIYTYKNIQIEIKNWDFYFGHINLKSNKYEGKGLLFTEEKIFEGEFKDGNPSFGNITYWKS